MRRLLFILALILPLSALPQCQSRPMMGTDFWVTFCSNANRGVGDYFFYVIAPRQCVVTVANGFDNNPMLFSVDTVPAESLVCIPLPHYFVFHVTSTDSITLYASNFTEASWDITTVLPTHALRKHYIVQTYSDHSLPDREPEFRFITTEFHNHDTIIKKHYNEDDPGYNPTVTTYVGYRENRPYTQQYHCYGGWSLSGTELHSEYPSFHPTHADGWSLLILLPPIYISVVGALAENTVTPQSFLCLLSNKVYQHRILPL